MSQLDHITEADMARLERQARAALYITERRRDRRPWGLMAVVAGLLALNLALLAQVLAGVPK